MRQELRPLQIKLPFPLGNEHVGRLSLGAALWGLRHGLLSFENLVDYAKDVPAVGALADLAALTKEEYSEKGAELVRKLEVEQVEDTKVTHQRHADEAVSCVYACVLAQRQAFPNIAVRTIEFIAEAIDFVGEEEWTGLPATAPYLHDFGFSPEWVAKIHQARALLHPRHSVFHKIKTWLFPEKKSHDLWSELERRINAWLRSAASGR